MAGTLTLAQLKALGAAATAKGVPDSALVQLQNGSATINPNAVVNLDSNNLVVQLGIYQEGGGTETVVTPPGVFIGSGA